MRRRTTVQIAALAALIAVVILWAHSGGSKRPNVILISVDTLRADHLGCYGYPQQTSPAIDTLASDGVRFANAFSQASWTLPSHMSVMTSQYPQVHGVTDDQFRLREAATTLAETLSWGGYKSAAFVSWVYLGEAFGFAQGFEEFTPLIDRSRLRMASGGGAFRAERVSNAAIRWIRRGQPDPFFLFVHYFDPHMDYDPPAPYDLFFDSDYAGEADGTHRWASRYIATVRPKHTAVDPRDKRHMRALYDGEIRYTDAQVARLLQAIDAAVGLDDCLVVLMSDHGEEFNDHGSMEGHGWTLYDEILHVPLIFRLPGRARAGTVIDGPVELLDIAPTILEIAGISAPSSFQGRSLAGLIHASEQSPPGPLVFAAHSRFNIVKHSVRGPRYKLIHTEDTGVNSFGVTIQPGFEFYDLREDPGELENLYDEASPLVRHFEPKLREFSSGRPAEAEEAPRVQLPAEDIELLRSLGYVE